MNIQAIAKICGVSVATISRVLNNSPNVRPETRDKVIAIMSREGYTPNAFAQGLGHGTMRMVGLLCTDVANEFYSKAVSLLERDLRAKGYDTLLSCCGTRLEDKKKSLRKLLSKNVDAIMLVGAAFRERSDNSHIAEAAISVPIFLINAYVDIPNVFCVYCDEREAMSAAVCKLYAAGFSDILYIHDMMEWAWAGKRKLEGIRAGLHECGITGRPDLLCACEKGIEPAKQVVLDLLERGVCFDAVIACEDELAVGAQKGLIDKGLNLPVIGFNNSLLTECTMPTISSIDNMLSVICPTAVSLLIQYLDGERAPSKVTVSGILVERDSFRST